MKRPTYMNDDTGHKVEAIGSWDHAVEPSDVGLNDYPKEENFTSYLRHVFVIVNGCFQRFRYGMMNDTQLREDYLGHTEEEVAGERMAVSDVIHQDSFNAPC